MQLVKPHAPYASTVIPLYLSSVTGMRYRTIHCIECGAEMLERNSETLYRLNDDSRPTEVSISAVQNDVLCGNCQQAYAINVSLAVQYNPDGPALHLHPQTIQLAIVPDKKLRNIHCIESGHVFHALADRIGYISDNRVPMEYIDPMKAGPQEAICRAQNCHQLWAIMV
jgi:hypothetical protein